MEWSQIDYLVVGVVVGYILNPLLASFIAVMTNAWNATGSACNGDCNQGRSCNCGSK